MCNAAGAAQRIDVNKKYATANTGHWCKNDPHTWTVAIQLKFVPKWAPFILASTSPLKVLATATRLNK